MLTNVENDAKAWSLRFAREGDEQGILDLLAIAFDGWPKIDIAVEPIEHLRWKLRLGEPEGAFHVVAVDGSRVVGCAFNDAHEINVHGKRLPACIFFENAVHPDYQGKGMMSDLWAFEPERFQRAFRVWLGASSNRIVRRKTVKGGTDRLHENKIDELKFLRPRRGEPASPSDAWTIRDVAAFDNRIDLFAEEASKPFDVIVARNKAFLNWRYADRRAGLFSIRIAEHEGALLGYCVLTTSRTRATIADLLARPGREDVADALVRDAIANAWRPGVESLRCWSSVAHPYRRLFADRGFRARREVRGVAFGSYHVDLDMSFRQHPEASIHIVPGDTDLV